MKEIKDLQEEFNKPFSREWSHTIEEILDHQDYRALLILRSIQPFSSILATIAAVRKPITKILRVIEHDSNLNQLLNRLNRLGNELLEKPLQL